MSAFLILILVCGCAKNAHEKRLTLATTTSTRDSGLLDSLLPIFEQQAGIKVKVVAVGSGQALAMGKRGDADVLLTHAPDAEKEFIAQEHGLKRVLVMYNDFVLVGAKDDPAKIQSTSLVVDALKKIAQSQSAFVSRGDDSGTHRKEQKLWKKTMISPQGEWYFKVGSGMAATLRVANEKRAYTLTDRATFLAHRKHLDLNILLQGDELMRNQYAVMVVNPKKHPTVQHELAQQFVEFLIASKTQQKISTFGIEKYGSQLFFPNAVGK